MTDRSSEERSRFEKLEAAFVRLSRKYGKDWAEWQDVRDAFDEFREARAALEDRQEAAPLHRVVIDNPLAQFTELSLEMCVHSQGGDFQDRMRCFPSAKFHMWCDLGRILQNRGVPSEATPSKENETVAALRELNFALAEEVARLGKKSGPRVIAAQSKLDRLDWATTDQVFTGPTPEMQAVRRKYHESAPAPVGTPQKETPPISEEVAAWRNLYPSAEFSSVPEGVQGKEPQTPTAQELAKGYCTDMIATLQANVREGKETLNKCPRCSLNKRTFCLACVNQLIATAKASGEAAGRRSAITELQEWIPTVREDPFDPWSAGYNKGYDAVSKKCAELQEKTK